jgi:hypothetical protein
LARIIETRLPPGVAQIDFFSIDVEGLDLQVLQSNDWRRFAPRAVIAECFDTDLEAIQDNEVSRLMGSLGYKLYAKTGHSVVFVHSAVQQE